MLGADATIKEDVTVGITKATFACTDPSGPMVAVGIVELVEREVSSVPVQLRNEASGRAARDRAADDKRESSWNGRPARRAPQRGYQGLRRRGRSRARQLRPAGGTSTRSNWLGFGGIAPRNVRVQKS